MVTLTLASGAGVEGGSISLDLSISSTGGDLPTQVQFSLSFSPADLTLTNAVLGAAAITASKNLSRAGSLVVIWAVNTTAIADGVLATLTFLVANPASAASLPITVSAVIASDAGADALGTAGSAGAITLDLPVVLCPVDGGSAVRGTPYSAQLLASGGTGPYTFSIIS